jgi:serine/threonine protein kinase
VKEAQAAIGAREFGKTDLSYSLAGGPQTVVYCDESLRYRSQNESATSDAPVVRASRGGALPTPDPKGTASPPIRDYLIGDMIDGKFKVLDVLGSGGFSRVYRVLDPVGDSEVALKMFDSDGYSAARREINALRKVNHPNVVKVVWADKTADGEWYLITEFVNGEPLSEYTAGVKHLRDREAVDVALDVLNALIAIHPDGESEDTENFLVHRDIKPQNIMLTRSGAKLLDFNIASRVGDPVKTMAGTPPYQPPDGVVAKWDVSPDLFALGVTLYELFCNGEHPYENAKPMLDTMPIDPRDFRPDLNADLAEFLIKACHPEREARFQTAAEMKTALESIRMSI